MSHLAMKDELPGLTEGENNLVKGASGYLMRHAFTPESNKPLYYIGSLLRTVYRLAGSPDSNKLASWETWRYLSVRYYRDLGTEFDEAYEREVFERYWARIYGGSDGE